MKSTRALTLIELLIVVAIMSIISVGTMALFVAPIREHPRIQFIHEVESGTAAFVGALVAEVHAARAIDVSAPNFLVLEIRNRRVIEYRVDEDGNLRKRRIDREARGPESGAILTHVTNFTATVENKVLTLNISVERTVVGEPINIHRQVRLNMPMLEVN